MLSDVFFFPDQIVVNLNITYVQTRHGFENFCCKQLCCTQLEFTYMDFLCTQGLSFPRGWAILEGCNSQSVCSEVEELIP